MSNITRFDETQKEDAEGVNHALSIMENLSELRPDAVRSRPCPSVLSLEDFGLRGSFDGWLGIGTESELQQFAEMITSKTQFLEYLLNRVLQPAYDDNKGYAAELLSILAQSSSAVQKRLAETEAMDKLMTALAVRSPTALVLCC